MTKQTRNQPAAREIDTNALDQMVGGAGIVVHDLRKQEQADKLVEESRVKAG